MSDTFADVARFICPFCGLEASAVQGVAPSTALGVVHAEPPCEQFVKLEPNDYLHQVNRVFRLHLSN